METGSREKRPKPQQYVPCSGTRFEAVVVEERWRFVEEEREDSVGAGLELPMPYSGFSSS